MTANDDLAQALDNLEIIEELPEIVDRKLAQWKENCLKLTRLMMDFRTGQIDRSLLRPNDKGPRCFREIGREVMSKVFNREVEKIEGISNLIQCSKSRYAGCLKLLLEAEEIHQAVEMRKHDLADQQVEKVSIFEFGRLVNKFGFKMANLAYKTPSIVSKDYIILENRAGSKLIMQIDNASDDYIRLPTGACERVQSTLEGPLKVSFVSQGTPFKACQEAVMNSQHSETMQKLIFEEDGNPQNEIKLQTITNNEECEELKQRLDKLNECQRAAVIGILEAKCIPKPYILFGPPGTGKTHTLVEAVVQVHKRAKIQCVQPPRVATLIDSYTDSDDCSESVDSDYASGSQNGEAKILVCINSNNCTDDVHEKIKRELPYARVTRLSAGNFLEDNDKSDVVVTTNIKSASIVGKFLFDYVFLDEAGHANIAESLVPASVLKPGGCFVLAGDPRQLGPVVTCDGAADLGFEESLLDRLFKFDIYQLDPITRDYDGRYITMLRDCYRCDPRILTTCNRLFYYNKLRCINSTPQGLLKILQFTGPLQIHQVSGAQKQVPGSDSWFNQAEIDVCIGLVKRLYMMGFEPDQVGVTSPYKLQAHKIRSALRNSIDKNRDVSGTLWQRFVRFEYIRIDKWANFNNGVTLEAIKNLKLPGNSTFCEKMDDGSYVPCSINSLPEDYVKLFVKRPAKWICKVDSIDAFQGGEREIMIISTVRTEGGQQSLRFISDPRRFNVAISRAKWLVIVVGDGQTIERARYWDELLEQTKSEVDAWPKLMFCSQPFSQQRPLFRNR